MSLLSDLKLAAQILGLVILIITLVLALRRFTTNNTDNATQRLPSDNLATDHGVINRCLSLQCTMYYVGLLVIHTLFLLVGLFELRVMNGLFCEGCNVYIVWMCFTF